MTRLERWVRDRRYHLTRHYFPQKSFAVSGFPWEIQMNATSRLFLIINQMHSTIVIETFLLEHSLKMNLLYHLSLSPQPSLLQIIVCLYKPNFLPFKIFISLADDEPSLPRCIWPFWTLQCQPTALFLTHLSFLLHLFNFTENVMSSLFLIMANHLLQSWNEVLLFTVAPRPG